MADKKRCFSCKGAVSETDKFCGKCGLDITDKYCPFCGDRLRDMSCNVCGKKISLNTQADSVNMVASFCAQPRPQAKSSSAVSAGGDDAGRWFGDDSNMSGNELNIPSKACSLDNYIRRKSADRSGFLSKKKSLTTNSKRHPTKQQKGQKACVSISVGIVRLSAHKELSIKRGSRVFVSVPRNANSDTVKKLAVDKHANLNQYFCALEDYVLLYPDTKVVEFLPGSNENFDVEKYKELL